MTTTKKDLSTVLILILGILLGVFSKWLDNTPLNDEIWWQQILNSLDLRNVFSLLSIWLLIALCISIYSKTPFRAGSNVFVFFLGMNISYHLYSIVFAGFNPMNYMMIWYGITIFSPLLAVICWYGGGNGALPLAINTCIMVVMILCNFSIGMWYFDYTNAINTIIFILTIMVLHKTPKRTMIQLTGGLIIAFILRLFI